MYSGVCVTAAVFCYENKLAYTFNLNRDREINKNVRRPKDQEA